MPVNNNNNNRPIDLGEIYGFTSMNEVSDSVNDITALGIPIPSLEQIAAYNQASRVPGFSEEEFIASFGTNQPIQNIPQSSFQNSAAATTAPQNNELLSNAMMPDLSQMYSPITQQDIEETPTPANTIGPAIAELPITSNQNNNQNITNESLGVAISDFSNPYPVTPESIQFMNGFIRTQVGRRVSVDFLVGSNNMVTKTGFLLGVATNYILINELDTDDITVCDFYNIKFIRIFY
ncbi:MAG: hypothetical protein J1E56_06320 [Ruminococcus sp.]|nr:hypothetical protein [Ruminococcus sp.]